MKAKDITLLNEMKEMLVTFPTDNRAFLRLADNLDLSRANLEFKDQVWDQYLVQQIATLDSASTFVPKNQEQNEQTISAVKNAVEEILRLIDEKLVHAK